MNPICNLEFDTEEDAIDAMDYLSGFFPDNKNTWVVYPQKDTYKWKIYEINFASVEDVFAADRIRTLIKDKFEKPTLQEKILYTLGHNVIVQNVETIVYTSAYSKEEISEAILLLKKLGYNFSHKVDGIVINLAK